MTLHYYMYNLVLLCGDRGLATRLGCHGSATVLPPEGMAEQQRSRSCFLWQHDKG